MFEKKLIIFTRKRVDDTRRTYLRDFSTNTRSILPFILCRLTPLYGVVLLVYVFIVPYVADGPYPVKNKF